MCRWVLNISKDGDYPTCLGNLWHLTFINWNPPWYLTNCTVKEQVVAIYRMGRRGCDSLHKWWKTQNFQAHKQLPVLHLHAAQAEHSLFSGQVHYIIGRTSKFLRKEH